MSLKKITVFISGLIISQCALAEIPVEVIDSCQHGRAVNSSVSMSKLMSPKGVEDEKAGCSDHFESIGGQFTYGAITCKNKSYVIINKRKIKLSTAVNHSINPSIKPGATISMVSEWWKIGFNKNDYLCIDVPLSMSGDGANESQYYLIEHPFDSVKPTAYYYFFNKDLMPLTAAE